MKAYVRNRYCGPEGLKLLEFQKPQPKPNEILVKVKAISINPADWHIMRGTPYFMRLTMGFPKPKNQFIGADVSGEVEAVGTDVQNFKIGDEVFTDVMDTGVGAFGEYVCTKADYWTKKPSTISHEMAAATPIAGITALQGLTTHGRLKQGQKVLINGASGGVGTYAVQLAKWIGAEVTTVCSTGKIDLVKSLGADTIIDYTKTDYSEVEQKFDLILDAVGNCTVSKAKKLLQPKGICLLIGWGGFGNLIKYGLGSVWVNKRTDMKLSFYTAKMNVEDLSLLAQLLEKGEIQSVIDRTYAFEELPEAIIYLEKGHAKGKVVVSL